ncbi:MAG: cation transporter [Chitinophagaceae bacterium]|nr:cation transporter [Chitinophagaceae bacterium]
MKKKYQILGLTCTTCEQKVKTALLQIEHIQDISVSKETSTLIITSDREILLNDIQKEIIKKGNYEVKIIKNTQEFGKTQKKWIQIYKPIILVFFYITTVTICIELQKNSFDWMEWMRFFMASFFLVFSFFKTIDIQGFAKSYQMYDIVAKRIPPWGYIYTLLEFFLGMGYLINVYPIWINIITFLIMSVSIIGVLQSVLQKKQIQCACLGTVFNLPMSTVTIAEDVIMIIMSFIMIFIHFI